MRAGLAYDGNAKLQCQWQCKEAGRAFYSATPTTRYMPCVLRSDTMLQLHVGHDPRTHDVQLQLAARHTSNPIYDCVSKYCAPIDMGTSRFRDFL